MIGARGDGRESGSGGSAPLEGEILPPADFADKERTVRERFWSKFRKVARRIPFAGDLVAAYYCAMDPGTPLRVRATLIGALAYFILPIDAIPDVIFGLGFTDDAAVLALAIKMVADHIKPEHRASARRALEDPATAGLDARTI
ncbi:MAG: YkvA family protein [Hyphomicrobiaceae bacterium]